MEYYVFDNGVKIPMVGLGTFPLKGEVLNETVKSAAKVGYELYDTAIAYHNEEEIGVLIRDGIIKEDTVFITSKVPRAVLQEQGRWSFLISNKVKRAYRQSCKKMGMQKLSAYLIHMPFDNCSKHYNDLINLYDKGQIKVIGVSNFDVRELKDLYDKCGRWPMMNQTEISPYNNQRELIEFCHEKGILVQAYSPFGRGNLVGELMNDSILVNIAKSHNRTVGQIVLRFIVQQGVAVVARSTNPTRLKDNVNIFDFQLTDEEMESVSKLNRNVVFGKNQVDKYKKKPVII